jgi:hypothetical protein
MPASLVLLQNEKADRNQLAHNTYTMVQVDGDTELNAISLTYGLKKQGLKVIKVTSVQLPPKKKTRGGKNTITVKRAKKFLVRLSKGDILKNDSLVTIQ